MKLIIILMLLIAVLKKGIYSCFLTLFKPQTMKILSFTLLVVFFLGMSCKKEKIKFEGYTATDFIGNVMGTTDPTDWTFDTYLWTAKEQSLFSQPSGFLTGTSAGTITLYPAYPNPCTGNFYLPIHATTSCKVRIAVANSKLELEKYAVVTIGPGGSTAVNFALDASYEHGQLYRVYYIFDAEGNIAFKKGHGDVMFK